MTHLIRRFFGSLRPRRPTTADEVWATSVLSPAEQELWLELPDGERAYAVRVAQHATDDLDEDVDRVWIAAALLHDVGKLDAHLGVSGRVVATIVGLVLSRPHARRWSERSSGFRARIGCYLVHDERGAARLRAAGARPEVAAWAEVHHRRDRWPTCAVPDSVCRALAAADDL